MAIKDIFTMIKADRYTQDGREELIKAQEAVTEDVTYKPGDISRKTGLQKQPDGSWAPVKNAPAQSKKMDKAKQSEIAKQVEFEKTVGDPAKARADYWKEINEASQRPMPGVEELYNKTVGKESVSGSAPSETSTTIKFEDAQKAIENGQVVQWQDRAGKWNDVDPKTSELVMARDIGSKLRVKTDENGNPVKAKPDPTIDETRSKLLELEKRRKKFEKYPDMDNNIKMQQAALLSKAGFGSRAEFEDFVKTMPTDSAPRILTGDCKIRIKKA